MRTQTVDIATCTGSVIDHGAHVMEWQPRGEGPVVFTSEAAIYAQDTAIRGGVPVCFPWFGPGREPGSPYGHGFARTTTWHQVANEVSDDAQTVTYRLSQDDATDDYWPHAYWALLTARFGTDLTVSLAVTNLDSVGFSYEAALHTYLCVDDIRQVRIEGLDGASYIDKTADMAVREQSGALTFSQETGSIFGTQTTWRSLSFPRYSGFGKIGKVSGGSMLAGTIVLNRRYIALTSISSIMKSSKRGNIATIRLKSFSIVALSCS